MTGTIVFLLVCLTSVVVGLVLTIAAFIDLEKRVRILEDGRRPDDRRQPAAMRSGAQWP